MSLVKNDDKAVGLGKILNGKIYFLAGLETDRELVRLSVCNDQLACGQVTIITYCACASKEHFQVKILINLEL